MTNQNNAPNATNTPNALNMPNALSMPNTIITVDDQNYIVVNEKERIFGLVLTVILVLLPMFCLPLCYLDMVKINHSGTICGVVYGWNSIIAFAFILYTGWLCVCYLRRKACS
jgi:hypothetical protein